MSSASFPWKDRVVVIAWVRNGYDKNHGSIGATAGQSLQDLGFDGDYFASRNGPILRDVRQFMPDNPKGEFVNIIRAIDDNIDSQIGHQQFAQKSQHALVWLLGLGLVVWLFMRWSKVQAEKETARSTIRKNDALVTAKLEQIKADSEALGKLDLHCATQLDAAKGLSVRQEEILMCLAINLNRGRWSRRGVPTLVLQSTPAARCRWAVALEVVSAVVLAEETTNFA